MIIRKRHLSLLTKPNMLYERLLFRGSQFLAQKAKNLNRIAKLKGTVAQRLNLAYTGSLELIEIVKPDHPRVIYDVGAHIGTWSLLAKGCIPNATIHAFEPIDAHITAFKKEMKNIPDITLHSVALGNRWEELKINITNRSDASSILDPTNNVDKDYGVRKEKEQTIQVIPLDNYIDKNNIPLPDFIKLDVQGYELEVLKGATNCLAHAKWILCEVSFLHYYQDQPLFHQIADFLGHYGFSIYAFGTDTPLGSRCTQADVLFKR